MSIKLKLITILLCAGLIPTLVVGTISYVTIGNQLRSNASEQLTSVSTKQQQKINTLLQDKQEKVIQLTNNYDFQLALVNYAASGNEHNLDDVNSIIQAQQLANPNDIQAISVANLKGVIFASTVNGTAGQSVSSQTLAQLNGGNANNIAIMKDPSDGIDKLYITTDISVNNQSTAILSVTWRIEDIVAAIQDYTGLGSTGETVVVEKDSKGNAISLFPLRFNTEAALKMNLNSLHLFDGKLGSYSNVEDYRSQQVTVSARPVGFADWMIATKIDNQETLAPIVQLGNSLVTITVVSLLIIAAVAWYLARLLTRPIVHIANIAKLIGQGDFTARVNLRSNDEIGALGNSINSMGLNLKDFVASIEAQRNRLQIILNSTTESILAIDKDGVIIMANNATTDLTAGMDTLVGKHINDVFNWTKYTKPFVINYNTTGTDVYSDLQYTSPSNAIHFVKVIVSLVSGEHKQTEAQTIITIYDETKSRELEAMKVDFVSMAAHELRTPLAAVRGYLELATYKATNSMTEETGEYLQQALKRTADLGGLINSLLDITRIEQGTLTLHMDDIDLAANISQAVKDAHFSAQEKNLRLTYSGPEKGCRIVGDEMALREVIDNLLSNAIKYTPANGEIATTLSQQDKNFIVRVKDTGLGIPQKALPNLFTKFYRVHGGLNSGSTGTGLGLFISKAIIERHHGTITVESHEGGGSTFIVTIPALIQERLDVTHNGQLENIITRKNRGWITKNITR